jgi:hypothetical protein
LFYALVDFRSIFLEKTNSIGDGDDDDDAGAVISSLASPATNCKETLIIYSNI